MDSSAELCLRTYAEPLTRGMSFTLTNIGPARSGLGRRHNDELLVIFSGFIFQPILRKFDNHQTVLFALLPKINETDDRQFYRDSCQPVCEKCSLVKSLYILRFFLTSIEEMLRLLLFVSLTLGSATGGTDVCTLEEKTMKGKKANRPGCWLSSQYKKRLCKTAAKFPNVQTKVNGILNEGESLLGIAGNDFDTSDSKCLRVAQAYKRTFELIVQHRNNNGAEPQCQRHGHAIEDQALEWMLLLLVPHVAPAPPPQQASGSQNSGRPPSPIQRIAFSLFDFVRRSKLAGRFGDGGYMTIKGQLQTLEFFYKNPTLAGELINVLKKFEEELNVWQDKGQDAGSKAGGWKMFFQRPQREGLSWFTSKPSFTFPPGYLLSLVCAVTSTSQELVEDDVLRMLGLVDKAFNQEEAVGNILNCLKEILVQPDSTSSGKSHYWLDILREQKQLFSTMMEMDLFMATRRRRHKSVGKEVEAIEMGARVPGELFARFMYDSSCKKFIETSKAVKGLEVFAKFVFFSQTLEKSVEASKGGASNVDDEIVREGASFFFNLLDSEKKPGDNVVQAEFDNFINHIRRKNRRRIAGKFVFRTVMAVILAAKGYLLAPAVAGGLAALSSGALLSSLDPASWGPSVAATLASWAGESVDGLSSAGNSVASWAGDSVHGLSSAGNPPVDTPAEPVVQVDTPAEPVVPVHTPAGPVVPVDTPAGPVVPVHTPTVPADPVAAPPAETSGDNPVKPPVAAPPSVGISGDSSSLTVKLPSVSSLRHSVLGFNLPSVPSLHPSSLGIERPSVPSFHPSSLGINLPSASSLHPSSWNLPSASSLHPASWGPSVASSLDPSHWNLHSASVPSVRGSSWAPRLPSGSTFGGDVRSVRLPSDSVPPIDFSSLGAKLPSSSVPSVGANVPSAPSLNVAASVNLNSGDAPSEASVSVASP